jgi:hypothetical protein
MPSGAPVDVQAFEPEPGPPFAVTLSGVRETVTVVDGPAGQSTRPDSSLIATKSANAGHPATTRPTGTVAPTAVLAATLAAVPATSAAQTSQPDRRPIRRSASSISDATISMPSTLSGNTCARHPVSPCCSARIFMCAYDTAPAMTANAATATPAAPRIARSAAFTAHPRWTGSGAVSWSNGPAAGRPQRGRKVRTVLRPPHSIELNCSNTSSLVSVREGSIRWPPAR